MRHARAAFVTAVAACLLTTALTTATAQNSSRTVSVATQGLYAPSDLVLAVGPGPDAANATVTRSVTLTCAPSPAGTHPAAADACAELAAVNGMFAELSKPAPHALCTKEWAPVTISATGVWEGRRIDWSTTYANGCTMNAELARSTALAF
ncbi:SSI family serine proteinase inhibitor [Streptomyces sp. NPDC059524]|uniref:SSI family serine proteinase inhibitor n=1 Tax=Streptomyces sp. NPDC059524 TaxID=3346856 RepID=UPI00369A3A47